MCRKSLFRNEYRRLYVTQCRDVRIMISGLVFWGVAISRMGPVDVAIGKMSAYTMAIWEIPPFKAMGGDTAAILYFASQWSWATVLLRGL